MPRGRRMGHRPAHRHVHRAPVHRRPVVVVRRPMGGMMMGMATGMMLGSMMAMASRNRNNPSHCETKESEDTIVVIIHQPGILAAVRTKEGLLFQTFQPGQPIPENADIILQPGQLGTPIAKGKDGKLKFKVIPPGEKVPKGAKVIKVQIVPVTVIHKAQPDGKVMQITVPLGQPIPPGSTVIQLPAGVPGTLVAFNQPDGGCVHQIIPPNQPIPPNATVIQPMQLQMAPPQGAPNPTGAPPQAQAEVRSAPGSKVDTTAPSTFMPAPYGDESQASKGKDDSSDSSDSDCHHGSGDESTEKGMHPQQSQQPQQPQQYPPQQHPPQYPPQQYPPQQYPPQQYASQGQPPQQGYPTQVQYPQGSMQPGQGYPAPMQYGQPHAQQQQQQPPQPQQPQQQTAHHEAEERPEDPLRTNPPDWLPDERAQSCMNCKTEFSAFNRRHHCRYCGKIFCGDCSRGEVELPEMYGRVAVRVCNPCYKRIQHRDPPKDDGCIIL